MRNILKLAPFENFSLYGIYIRAFSHELQSGEAVSSMCKERANVVSSRCLSLHNVVSVLVN